MADACQSLYARGFRWEHVHERLRLKGRTTILRRNYRTSQEIAGAASQFLEASKAGDSECLNQECTVSGPQPVLRGYRTETEQLKLIGDFVKQMSRFLRLKPSTATILVPTAEMGRRLATGLTERGLAARYMTGGELDLGADEVKVLTLHSAKGWSSRPWCSPAWKRASCCACRRTPTRKHGWRKNRSTAGWCSSA